ncbi:MAG: hypothetical protein A2927_03330 [Candidatus Komeilibacteria bacterium RIFCSPLOWO2_01_FULL_45_10]|uniref:bAvd-like domain-containing protein n=1 Tax=Candidatus Komeilibacteria bacterium RIFCSPLOWO2_01_FULL_45_10 TaxID=1798550 RepID=A0A1G2BKY7_9BACT|nr:MAG: hypothetical protein A2927_03330 [Candidatus Komeilibacteria bacterium RIFCSPLOWO2_01_FULL_45_10]
MDNLPCQKIIGEMPIIIKIRELYKLFYKYLILFPKKDKYTLGAKCENYILATLELLLAAGNAPKSDKLRLIRQASIKFDTLKFFIRVSRELDVLDFKKYLELQKRLQEIGLMLGGWLRSLDNR